MQLRTIRVFATAVRARRPRGKSQARGQAGFDGSGGGLGEGGLCCKS